MDVSHRPAFINRPDVNHRIIKETMTEFRNDFSWSKSRDEVFQTCPRQYYFNYYGYWGGWEESAPERTRQIYVIKKLKNRFMWAGEKVHD